MNWLAYCLVAQHSLMGLPPAEHFHNPPPPRHHQVREAKLRVACVLPLRRFQRYPSSEVAPAAAAAAALASVQLRSSSRGDDGRGLHDSDSALVDIFIEHSDQW